MAQSSLDKDQRAYSIRPATKADAPALRELRLRALSESPEAFGSSYEEEQGSSVEDFAERIPEGGEAVIYVAVMAERIVGMGGFWRETQVKTRHKGNIWGMYVAPEDRGLGIGRAVIEALLAHAAGVDGVSQVHLSVVTGNEPAVRLYESVGFRVWGTEPAGLVVGGAVLDEHHMIYQMSGSPR